MIAASGRSPDAEPAPPGTVGLARAVGGAVGLALLSVVPVAWSLLLAPPGSALENSGFVQGPIDWRPIAPISAALLALVVVVPSAVVGGFAGGLIWRWRRFAGGAVALASAWFTGIVLLPVAASMLGIHLRAAIVCVMGCESLLRDDRPLGGLFAYGVFVAGTFFLVWSVVVPVAVALIVVRVLYAWVRGRSVARPRLPLLQSMVAFSAVHGVALVWTVAVTFGGLIAYLSLALGVVAWTTWMTRGGRILG
jgi:hypothetical protein